MFGTIMLHLVLDDCASALVSACLLGAAPSPPTPSFPCSRLPNFAGGDATHCRLLQSKVQLALAFYAYNCFPFFLSSSFSIVLASRNRFYQRPTQWKTPFMQVSAFQFAPCPATRFPPSNLLFWSLDSLFSRKPPVLSCFSVPVLNLFSRRETDPKVFTGRLRFSFFPVLHVRLFFNALRLASMLQNWVGIDISTPRYYLKADPLFFFTVPPSCYTVPPPSQSCRSY